MNTKFTYLIIFLFLGIQATGQNLVRNPGFEDRVGCPDSDYEFVPPPGFPGHTPFKSITDWYNVNGQTPEYFNICDTGYILCQHISPHPFVPDTSNVYRYGVPTNYTGVTFVDSGDAFIGLLLYYRLNGGSIEDMAYSQRREFASTSLNAPLTAGEQYYVGFVYRMAPTFGNCDTRIDRTLGIDRLGILFSDTFLYSGDPTYIPPSPPQLENPVGNVLFDTTEWVSMSWIYSAEGNEKVMTIGNFYETSQITHPPMEELGHYRSFFFFDNFCVRNINDPVDSFGNSRTVGICNYDTVFTSQPAQWRVWNTGDTAGFLTYDQIPFGGQDTVKMSVKSIFNCKIHMDTIVVYKKPTGIIYNIDTTLCTNDTALLNLGKIYPNLVFFDSVHQKMRNPPTLDNQTAGKYRFYFKLADSCTDNFGTVNVTVIQTPEIHLEDLTLKCIGDSALISVQDSVGTLLWNTGATTQSIIVKENGNYTVTMTNVCGSTSDHTLVQFEKCENCLLIPNAFSPNGDGLNDRFEIKNKCHEFLQYRLQIYDRWGKLMFASYDVRESWDGTYSGKSCDQGIYFFILSYAGNIVPESDYIKGEIHLVR